MKFLNLSDFIVDIKSLNQNFVLFYKVEKNCVDKREHDTKVLFKSSIRAQRQ